MIKILSIPFLQAIRETAAARLRLCIGRPNSRLRPMPALPDKFLAAMIAVLPLPGSPRYAGDDDQILAQALSDLEHYKQAGADAIVLENSHHLPYVKPPPPTP